jgi:hypothetical protein
VPRNFRAKKPHSSGRRDTLNSTSLIEGAGMAPTGGHVDNVGMVFYRKNRILTVIGHLFHTMGGSLP